MRRLVTINEVANLLGKSVKTVRRRVAKGVIPAIQEGGKGTDLRFDLDDVIEAIKAPTAPKASASSQNNTKTHSRKRPGPQPKWKQ